METTFIVLEYDMDVSSPIWSLDKSSYVFKLSGSDLPSFTMEPVVISNKHKLETPGFVLDTEISSFVDTFIQKTTKHFAAPLRSSFILSRVKHVWQVGTTVFDDSDTKYLVMWTLKEMIVKPKEFCLVWMATYTVYEEPVISSNFLNLSSSRSSSPAPNTEVKTIHIQPLTSSEESDIPMDMSDLNNPGMMTLEYETSGVSMDKKKIREARLRAALANLRAERLTEKYYQKYGTPESGDESELSSESDEEDELKNKLYR